MHDNLWKMFSAYKTILKPNPEKSFYVKQVAKKIMKRTSSLVFI